MAGPPANRVRQSYGSAPATPRERVYVSRAADDPPESAPPAGCTRKSRPDPGIDRASSPSRRITAGKVNHRPFALASFFSKLLDVFLQTSKPRHTLGAFFFLFVFWPKREYFLAEFRILLACVAGRRLLRSRRSV